MKLMEIIAIAIALAATALADTSMRVTFDKETGRALITDDGKPVLNYNYQTVPIPEGFFKGIPEKQLGYARKYAIPRSNYLHPLYGPDGQKLTTDWNKDHAHHRGIYWAWPEVQLKGELGDLHALQRVWARPTGKIETRHGEDWAEVEAESRWMWEDKTPIVREVARIRGWKSGKHGRHIDLEFRFEALEDGVTLARRGTQAYGGLNIRLAPIAGMKLAHHADPADAALQMAWQAATGSWTGAETPLSITVFEKNTNLHYPGDYAQYSNLPWFQPTFPKAGLRHTLIKGQPLTLRYRIWIQRGAPPTEDEFRTQWKSYNTNKKKEKS